MDSDPLLWHGLDLMAHSAITLLWHSVVLLKADTSRVNSTSSSTLLVGVSVTLGREQGLPPLPVLMI